MRSLGSIRRTALATAASGFAAALALAVSTYNVYLQRQQVRAAVWPRLSWDCDFGEDGKLVMSLHNGGVGPAAVKSVHVRVDGEAMPTWPAALTKVLRREHIETLGIGTIEDAVISAGGGVEALTISQFADARDFLEERRRLRIDVCYCSTLDECWEMTTGVLSQPATRAVDRCPADLHPFHSVDDGEVDSFVHAIGAHLADGGAQRTGADADAAAAASPRGSVSDARSPARASGVHAR